MQVFIFQSCISLYALFHILLYSMFFFLLLFIVLYGIVLYSLMYVLYECMHTRKHVFIKVLFFNAKEVKIRYWVLHHLRKDNKRAWFTRLQGEFALLKNFVWFNQSNFSNKLPFSSINQRPCST